MQTDLAYALAHKEEFVKDGYRRGLWRAKVLRVDDSQSRGRIQVRIEQLHPPSIPRSTGQPVEGVADDLCPWAEPAFPFGGYLNTGFLMLPKVGSTVWVAFEMGYTANPVWLGGWYGRNEIPAEFAADPANVRMLRTPGGHHLIFDDSTGAEFINLKHSAGHVVEMSATQIKLSYVGGTKKIEINPTNITVTSGAITLVLNSSGGATLTCTTLGITAPAGVTVKAPVMTLDGNVTVTSGASGVFAAGVTTVTVQNGIITSLV
jgi:uncharacterized protein involved in type VI secretion and phage assembly